MGAEVMDAEMSVIMSPVQLAAVLNHQQISSAETRSNRLTGGLKTLGGTLEMVGAAALLLAPEPTMATKVGGVALAVHGSDTISAGFWQLWTGQTQRTLTEQASTELALRLGADPADANREALLHSYGLSQTIGWKWIMHMDPYPYLKQFLGSYFHQDCYDSGDTDEDIIREFLKSSWDYQRMGLLADIHRLLHQHDDELLPAIEQAFAPDIVIGETNEEVRAWLLQVVHALEKSSGLDTT